MKTKFSQKKSLFIALVIIGCLNVTHSARADLIDIGDVTFTFSGSTVISGYYQLGQQITPTKNNISAVNLYLQKNLDTTDPLEVFICTGFDGDTPTGIIGQEDFPAAGISTTFQWHTLNFTSLIDVTAYVGSQIWIVFEGTRILDSDYFVRFDATDPISGGDRYSASGQDIWIQTYYQEYGVISEFPAITVVLGFSSVLIASIIFFKRKRN